MKEQKFLGLVLQHQNDVDHRASDKDSEDLNRIKQLEKQTFSRRWIASLLGKIIANIPAVGNAVLHVRFLHKDLARNLLREVRRWENPCPLSSQAKQEMICLKEEANMWNGRPIRTPDVKWPQATPHDLHRRVGYRMGAKSEILQVARHWTEEKNAQLHKLQGAESGSHRSAAQQGKRKRQGDPPVYGQHRGIEIYTETTWDIFNNVSGSNTGNPGTLGDWSITVHFAHIRGVENVDADKRSRRTPPSYQRSLPQRSTRRSHKDRGREG